jgi:hypothetical protein
MTMGTLRDRWNALDHAERLLLLAGAVLALRWVAGRLGQMAVGWFWTLFGLAWVFKYAWF